MNRLEELKKKLGELQTRREDIKSKMDSETKPSEIEMKALEKEYSSVLDDLKDVLNKIDQVKIEMRADEAISEKGNVPSSIVAMGPAAEGKNYPLGEYMRDIAMFTMRGERSPRFANQIDKFKAVAAASGMNEAIPSDGGFLVNTDQATNLNTRIYDEGQILSRCNVIGISPNSGGLTLNGIDETSRADGSRYGGVRGYWEDEADDIVASKPKFNPINLKLKKVAVAYYATEELLADAGALQQDVDRKVAGEITFKIEDAIIRGSGAGKPQGIVNFSALVQAAKQNGQGADTILWENVRDMYALMWAGSRKSSIWLANDECLPQLMDMVKPVGTSGVAVWLPANQAVNQPFDTLLGRPILYPEQCSALGDLGDFMFVDFSQIQLIDKGGIQGASSIHVRFLQDERVFKFTKRIDGQAMWKSALTPYKGKSGTKKSPFVALAERA